MGLTILLQNFLGIQNKTSSMLGFDLIVFCKPFSTWIRHLHITLMSYWGKILMNLSIKNLRVLIVRREVECKWFFKNLILLGPKFCRFILMAHFKLSDLFVFITDSLTLQLWRDGREAERGIASTKGSISLNDYIGSESGFNLDKEAHCFALVFKEIIVVIAFDERETLMKWQVNELVEIFIVVFDHIAP